MEVESSKKNGISGGFEGVSQEVSYFWLWKGPTRLSDFWQPKEVLQPFVGAAPAEKSSQIESKLEQDSE